MIVERKEILDQLVEDSFERATPQALWVIRWRGKEGNIRLSNGKSSWAQRGHAILALYNHIEHPWREANNWRKVHHRVASSPENPLQAATDEVDPKDYIRKLIEDGVITIEQI
jgi:hypothetical protein